MTPGGTTSNGSGSGSERMQGSEPPPTRKERVNSTASKAESHYSSIGPPQLSQRNSLEEPTTSPLMDCSPRLPFLRQQPRPASWKDGTAGDASGRQPLPSLSDMLDDGKMSGVRATNPSESSQHGGGFVAANHQRDVCVPHSHPTLPNGRVPPLRHEVSSNGSTGSGSSTSSYARLSGEGPVPIHTLLADRTMATPSQLTPTSSNGIGSPTEPSKMSFGSVPGPRGYGIFPPRNVHGRFEQED